MSAFKRIADVVHKSVVTGIFGGFLYVTLSVGVQVIEGKQVTKGEQIQAGFIQMMKDRASEEYSKYYKTDHREWYDKDVSVRYRI
jgi:hypothetical protein